MSDKLFIDGHWRPGSGAEFSSTSPSNGETVWRGCSAAPAEVGVWITTPIGITTSPAISGAPTPSIPPASIPSPTVPPTAAVPAPHATKAAATKTAATKTAAAKSAATPHTAETGLRFGKATRHKRRA